MAIARAKNLDHEFGPLWGLGVEEISLQYCVNNLDSYRILLDLAPLLRRTKQ